MTLTKIDLKRERAELYRATATPVILKVPPIRFLMIDGHGAPAARDFQDAVGALYTMSYTLKFDFKNAGRGDWVIPPLEGLWWIEGERAPSFPIDPARMSWRAMIPQPDDVTEEDVERARAEAAGKRDLPALSLVRFEPYAEGTSAQILHVGPYADEPATIARLRAFVEEEGFQPDGLHHEIYLSDPIRTAPERLRTILRQPVSR